MIRLAVRVGAEHAELVLAELLELSPAGVEEVQGEPGTHEAGTVEYAVYGAPGELPSLPDLRAAAGETLIDVSTSEVADDWSERWRHFHKPVVVSAPPPRAAGALTVPSLRVRPPWEPAAGELAEGSVQEIVIDPGQAFRDRRAREHEALPRVVARARRLRARARSSARPRHRLGRARDRSQPARLRARDRPGQ